MKKRINIMDMLKEYNPKVYKENAIRMMCPYRENHEGNSSFAEGRGTNSMFLSLDINQYHCFSCGYRGKVTSLLTKRFDVPYFDAVEVVNILQVEKVQKENYELNFYWDISAPDEFTRRNLHDEPLEKKFRVGIDKKGNICIPLYDENFILKGVKFRAPNGDFWYDKNFERKTYLYNYDSTYPYTIVVEGETDVYRLNQWNLNVVGIMGSHLTIEQAEMLSKIPIIYLALDRDPAGIKGMHNAYQLLKNTNDVRFILYDASDPEKCKKKNFIACMKDYDNYATFNYLTPIIKTKK